MGHGHVINRRSFGWSFDMMIGGGAVRAGGSPSASARPCSRACTPRGGWRRGTAAALLAFALVACAPDAPDVRADLELAELLGGADTLHARAVEPRAFTFPADHGAHPAFRTEWWYFTGTLSAAGRPRARLPAHVLPQRADRQRLLRDGRRFGRLLRGERGTRGWHTSP
jgi:hypothetical protein